MATSPDSVTYPTQDYGLLTPYPPVEVSVLDNGADPTGNDDCYLAFLETSQALPAGGVFVIPPGNFKLSRGIPLASGVHVRGAGGQASRIVAETNFADPGDAGYSFFYNENWSADTLEEGDTDITVTGVTFDYSWRTASNAFHPLNFRHVTRLRIAQNYFYYGGNSIACRGCEQVWVVSNSAFEFRNCAWDFWEGPGTTYVLNNYAETSDTAQMLNFNPEYSPVASSPLDVIGRRLVVQGNVFKGTGASSEPCQIEPLAARDNGIVDVVIDGNQFFRSYLVLRGYVEKAIITSNAFDDYPDPNTSVIVVYPNNGFTPKSIIIANNVINEPGTNSGNLGVIRCQTDEAVVTGNIITGTTYTGAPFYQGSSSPNHYGNWYEKLGITGRMRQGFVLTNPNGTASENQASAFAWEDLSGAVLRMYMSGNFHQFWSTEDDGTPRQVWSMEADSDTSDLNILIPGLFSDHLRIGTDGALTATGTTYNGALQLAKNFNVVTTVPAASGVRLPLQGSQSIAGWEITVWNLGEEMLAVYPASNAYIADAPIGVHDNLPPGSGRVYFAYDSTHWTIKAEQKVTIDLAGDDTSAQAGAASSVDLTTAPATEPPTYNINHVLLYGQSLSIGAEGVPGLSTVAKYDNLQFGDSVGATNNTTPSATWAPNGSAVPTDLAITGSYAEVPIFGALNTYRALTFRSQGVSSNSDQKMLASGCGIGGTAIAALEQGAAPDIFNRLVSCMDQVNAYCAGAALTYGVTAMVWLQGESDQTTAQATYKTALQGIYTDFCTAALAESGQSQNPAMFMYQTTARNGNYNTTGLGVQMAQLDIGLNDAGCFMVGPIYPYNDSGNLHLPANSYRWWASNLGKVMHRVLTLGQEWKPLHITSAEMRGRRVLVTYYVPYGPLVFDDPWLQTGWTPSDPATGAANTPFVTTDRGFTIRDSATGAGTTLDIASVVLVADNQILITLASTPPVATYYLYYADGSAGHYGHGSVRDSDPALADDIYEDLVSGQADDERQYNISGQRYPLYNWAVSQMVTITAV